MDEFWQEEGKALKGVIVARIRRGGPITFRDYMEMCLYHPRYGYYNAPRPPMGPGGDYLTSPEVSPIFGVLVGRQIYQMWEVMGSPHPFQVVEVGGGKGSLARALLEWARAYRRPFFRALQYVVVEKSPFLRFWARRLVSASGLGRKVFFRKALPSQVVGCVVTNEVLDSFPVHRVLREGGKLWEIYVGWGGSSFREELGPPSTPEIEAYFARLGLWPGEGCYAEVNLEAVSFIREVGKALARGFVVTIDYGYEAHELYAPWRKDGTLMCFYGHRPSPSPYLRPGAQDMTSHVDFTTLIKVGAEVGLETLGLISQAQFLANLGLYEAYRYPGLDLEEMLSRRRAVTELSDPAGLGRIRVLLQGKGVGQVRLLGLGG